MRKVCFALFALCLATPLAAQTSASLTGIVTGAGRPIAGISVTIASPALQGTRSALTGETGAYNFPALPPGDYTITFEGAGLETLRTPAILRLLQSSRVDAEMSPAGLRDAVTVVADAPSVLNTPEVSTSLTLRDIERLPIPRNQLATAQFAPGVTGNTLSSCS
jgi:Ca-activated chloride channel family protein